MRDRRLWFFLAAAAACVLLVPVSPSEFRWVAEATAGTYLVLAILFALDNVSRTRYRGRQPPSA
ncbi:MAG: hypothetical protein ABR540_07850 [Acidimicrobiales bacterium]